MKIREPVPPITFRVFDEDYMGIPIEPEAFARVGDSSWVPVRYLIESYSKHKQQLMDMYTQKKELANED